MVCVGNHRRPVAEPEVAAVGLTATIHVSSPNLALTPTIRACPDVTIQVIPHSTTDAGTGLFFLVENPVEPFETALDADRRRRPGPPRDRRTHRDGAGRGGVVGPALPAEDRFLPRSRESSPTGMDPAFRPS
ncbi:hypothetical protein [Halococcus salsus]|uniref:hypothetical protein n=1 Tax=Halococcus salsus TaxID=2162894 RepID=UPI001F046B4F|nr:hypothetical protein [Halococcus salsus]